MTELSKWSRLGQSLAIQRQFATHARRMAPGSLGGRTESASPASPPAGAGVLAQRQEAEATGGNPVAVFENDGTLDGALMRWVRSFTVGDTSWFQFPEGGTDFAKVEILRPGVLVAVLNVPTWASGGPFTPSIRYGASIIASGRVGSASSDVPNTAGGFVVLPSFIGAGLGLAVNSGSTASGMWGHLTVTWYDGTLAELTY